MNMEGQVIQVNLDDIIPNRFQPRIAFDEKALNELAASIKEHGIIQPLVLRKLGKKYEIIAGERRYKAATIAGLTTVPAVISNIDDNKSAEVALVENVQRKDLTPIEEARSYKNLLDKGYLTQEQLAKKMGLSQSAISNKLRLLNLDVKVQQALLDNKISERHARSLLKLTSPEDQKLWLDKVIKERLTVKKLDELLNNKIGENDTEGGDIPLVQEPDIEKIKEQATDINQNKPKNIANLLVSEDTMTEYSDNLPNQNIENAQDLTLNQASNATQLEQNSAPTLDPFNITQSSNGQEVLNEVPPTNNKFFNPLEDSPATMDNLNSFAKDASFSADETPVQDSDVEVFDMPSNNSTTSDDSVDSDISTPFEPSVPQPTTSPIEPPAAPVQPLNQGFDQIVNNPMPQPMTMDSMNQNINPMPNDVQFPSMNMGPEPFMQNAMPSAVDELNPNNKFFQPIQEQSVSSPMMETQINTTPVNPMDNVDNLINGNPEMAASQREVSLGNAINDIRGLVDSLNVKGLNITIDEADLEASYQMNISIMK